MRQRSPLPALAAVALAALACAAGDGPARPPDPSIAAILVTPGSATIPVGGSLQLAADARDAGNGPVAGAVVAWVSRAPATATVTPSGMVYGVAPGVVTIVASAESAADSATITTIATYDPDSLGVPRFIAHDYIDRSMIARVSRFRSGIGHDYSDGVEQCRSMKHYFQPRGTVDWGSVPILSPVAGQVTALVPETTFGSQIQIVPAALPAATVVIFHLNPAPGLAVGQPIGAGDTLGTHIGSQTMSDIAIRLTTLSGYRLVSYFAALPDSVFAGYAALGIATRDSLSITRADRDANPLACVGEAFTDQGTLPNWVDLP